jgi:hypothetical protein
VHKAQHISDGAEENCNGGVIMKRFAIGILLVTITGCGGGGSDPAPAVQLAPTINATGTWSGPYNSSVFGNKTLSLNLIQNNATLTGTFANSSGGLGNISGTVSGNTANFTISITTPGCSGSFAGVGTVTGNAMTFTYNGSTNQACGGPENGVGNLAKQ